MSIKREFNLPDQDDPDFANKLIASIQQLFEGTEGNIQNFTPISDPEEGTQVGSLWFDGNSGKFKVQTSNGVKILKYE